jgi:hypothetical protein
MIERRHKLAKEGRFKEGMVKRLMYPCDLRFTTQPADVDKGGDMTRAGPSQKGRRQGLSNCPKSLGQEGGLGPFQNRSLWGRCGFA